MTSWGGRFFHLALRAIACTVAMGPVIPAARAQQPPEATPRPLLACSVSGSVFADDELRRAYGTLPAVGLRVHVNDGPSAQYFLGIQYCARRGDNFYDDPVFESGRSSKLTSMPIEFGLRTDLRRGHRTGIYFGIAAEYLRIWESVPGAHPSDPNVSATIRSWGLGIRLLGGPEFELGRGPWIAGSEFSLGRSFTRSVPGFDQWTADLTGLTVRMYLARRL